MSTKQTQQPQFYENQFLSAEDLTAAVEYFRTQDARHILGAHTWGIAMGLQLVEKKSSAGGGQIEVFIQPGYAWDGFGRPIVVLAPFKIPTEKFKFITFDSAIDNGDPEGRLVEIWLRYDETATQSARPGFEVCDPEDQFSRVQETFRLEAGERRDHSDRHDRIAVAGRSVDAAEVFDATAPRIYDESIPFQEFPDDVRARWLIPIGKVRWKPNANPNLPGNFVERTPNDLEQSARFRQHIGIVAEGIHAAGDIIRLRKRNADPDAAPRSNDLVWVEGNLRVDQDLKLFGGKLDFRTKGGKEGSSGQVPLTIDRTDGQLRIAIGKNENGDNRLAIGRMDGETFQSKVVIKDNSQVGIGTPNPAHNLQVGDAGAPVSMSLRGPDLHVNSSTLAFEDDGGTGRRWFRLIHNTENNLLKLAGSSNSGEVTDPIIAFARNSGNVGIGTENPAVKLEVVGDVKTQGGNFFLGSTKIPVDVVVGEFVLNHMGEGSGIVTLDLVSRLPNASSADIMVALADIGNVNHAINARWRVTYQPPAIRLSLNSFQFPIKWQISDSDGYLITFSYVAIFLP